MRLIKALFALLFVLLGVIFGALNKQVVHVDLWARGFDARLGLTLLTVLLAGALLGGLVVTTGVVWPLRRRLHKATGSGSSPDVQELADDKDDTWPS
jgi:lipopolysaccharide assembly protein A